MSQPLPSKFPAAKLPTGPTVADVLDEMRRDQGLEPLRPEEIAALPPWTPEEADAFERVINEMFENVEPPTEYP